MPAPHYSGMASSDLKGPGVYLRAKVGGLPTYVVIDTGAQVSIISKQTWLQVTNGGAELMEFPGEALAANGGGMDVIGRWQTICQFDTLALIAEFLVADVPSPDILLGYDFLSKYGSIIDLDKQNCCLLGRKFPLILAHETNKPLVVTVSTDTMVGPRCEVILSGEVEGLLGGCASGMLEPSSSLAKHCDVLVARVVCQVDKGVMPVRVINVTETELMLKQGTKIGTLFTDVTVGPEAVGAGGGGCPVWSVDALMAQFGLEEKELSPTELRSVKDLLQRHAPIFSTGETDLGRTHRTLHQIDTGDARPIKMAPRRVPLHLQQEVTDHIKQMQDSGVIRPSCSPWAAPVVPVRKKDGSLRFCVDYRRLNDVTVKDAYPLPRIDDALDSLANACLFSTLDLKAGYWQCEIDPKDRPKTAFATRQGLFEFNVLSFGLCNAPSTFQRLMDLVLADLQWTTCLVYLDDIIVFGKTFKEHLHRLDEVLSKLGEAGLKVQPSKCHLFSTQVKYLGHIISREGIRADPAKVESVRGWPTPTTQTEVRQFLGLASYYRRFVKGFADIARPLHQLTEKGKHFRWGEDCQQAFLELKHRLTTAPVLAYPDPAKPFILDTDASDVGVGAVLSQEEGGMEHVIAYASRALTKEERKYATTKKELLGMVTFTKFFRHYLLGREFTLRTDHNSLRWLHNFQGLEGQLARWVEQLANFQYKIVHRPGKQHTNADALSRLPALPVDASPVNHEVAPQPSLSVRAVQEAPEPVQAVEQTPEPVRVVQEAPEPVPTVEEAPSETQAVQEVPELAVEDELARAQQEDLEIVQLIRARQARGGGVLPQGPEFQKYARVWEQLRVQDKRLVRIPSPQSDAAGVIQVVLPRSMVSSVLSMLHSTSTGGHLGSQKLQAKVKDRFYWPGWFGDVKKWCRECVDCASRKTQGRPPCAPMNPSTSSRPHERIALDILGPLPETERKNKYVLVIGDYFSKWTEAYPLPNQEAHTLAKVLTEQWVCRFGTPRSLHSDQGRNFESTLFKDTCRLLGIHKTRTSAYHPQSDGMIERFNRTLLSMLSLFIDDNQLNWDTLLPYVMMSYRSSVHASTGFTPYKVLFGQEIVLPVDVMLDVGSKDKFASASAYVQGLSATLATVVEAVKKHQTRASAQQKEAYDFRARAQYYSVGELVWVRNKARKRGVCPKLQRRYKGPFKVLECVTEVLYRVALVEGGPDTVIHFNRLKPFVPCSFTAAPVPTGREPGGASSHPSPSERPAGVPNNGGHQQPSDLARKTEPSRESPPAEPHPQRAAPLPTGQQSGGVLNRPSQSKCPAEVPLTANGGRQCPADLPWRPHRGTPSGQDRHCPSVASDRAAGPAPFARPMKQPSTAPTSQADGGQGHPSSSQRTRSGRDSRAPVWTRDYHMDS